MLFDIDSCFRVIIATGIQLSNESILSLRLHWTHEQLPKLFEWLPLIEPVLRVLPCLQHIELAQLHKFAWRKSMTKQVEKARTYLKTCRRSLCPDLAIMEVVIVHAQQLEGNLQADPATVCREDLSLLD